MTFHDYIYWAQWFMAGMLGLTILAVVKTLKQREQEADERQKRMDESMRGAPMTSQNWEAYSQLYELDCDERIVAWAAMLERRVAELDPQYQAYPFWRGDMNSRP